MTVISTEFSAKIFILCEVHFVARLLVEGGFAGEEAEEGFDAHRLF